MGPISIRVLAAKITHVQSALAGECPYFMLALVFFVYISRVLFERVDYHKNSYIRT
jgi:hypothetical protein